MLFDAALFGWLRIHLPVGLVIEILHVINVMLLSCCKTVVNIGESFKSLEEMCFFLYYVLSYISIEF